MSLLVSITKPLESRYAVKKKTGKITSGLGEDLAERRGQSKKLLHHPQGELAVEKDSFKDVCKRDLKAMKIGPDNYWEALAILYPESSGFSASS